MEESAITILHQMRKNLDNKIIYSRDLSIILFLIAVVDYIIFMLVGTDFFQLTSFGVLIIWIIHAVTSIKNLQDEKENIDEFYLEMSYDKKDKR